ncbi:MAG TPA: hypothetical protein VM536_12860, partial [Chloroflexia bacterium]|nr:hypothetical protein [Chloroflexia bacterium]
AIPNRQAIVAGDPALLQLIGYALGPAAPGQALAVTLYWQALAAIPQDYTVFVHVFDAQGVPVAQQDGQPLDGRAPTSWWAPGEVFRDVHQVDLPADLPPGSYAVQVGLYYWATGERLPLFTAAAQRLTDDTWQLPTTLSVSAPSP